MRILLEKRIQEVKDDCKGWAEVATKAKDKSKKLQNLVEELRADIFQKDTHLDYLQKRNDELSTLLNKAKQDTVVEFRASKQFTDLLNTNYVVGFEDFRMDAMENFPGVGFSAIKLNLGAASSLLQTSLILSLPRMSLMLEMTPHNENVKFSVLVFLSLFIFFLFL